jgi:hypothetical protein
VNRLESAMLRATNDWPNRRTAQKKLADLPSMLSFGTDRRATWVPTKSMIEVKAAKIP